jgi:uncharacterized protein (DUF736 family)
MTEQRQKNPDELGALWLKTSANGKKYMSGTIEGVGAVVIFKNERKTSDKAPDYRVFKSRPRDLKPADQDDPFAEPS